MCRAADEPEKEFKRAVLIRFEGIITPWSEQFLYRQLDAARANGVDLIIIEIESPGGYLEESRNIAFKLRDWTGARTVAYIPHEALSGAAIVALGCDDIIMAPNAVIGDAGVVYQGADHMFRYADEKIRTDFARRVRDLAAKKGRPPALAEAMVDKDLVVYRVTNRTTGDETYMSDNDIRSSKDPDEWIKHEPVAEAAPEDRFLEVNGSRAVELKLARATAANRGEMTMLFGFDERDVPVHAPGAIDTAAYILNLPLVTALMLILGLVALYFECNAPGVGIGALIAGLCFTLFFWSRFLGGTADWLEVILFLAGFAFLAMELFVIPGFGFAGITGILLLVVSLVLAGQKFVLPSNTRQVTTLTTSLFVVLGSGMGFLVAAIFLSRYFQNIPFLGRLILKPPTDEQEQAIAVDEKGKPVAAKSSNAKYAVGDWGVALSPLRPAGKIRVGDEYVDVVTDGSFVERGQQVRIVEIRGSQVVVREIEESD